MFILTSENKTHLEEVKQKLNQAFPGTYVDEKFFVHFDELIYYVNKSVKIPPAVPF